MPLSRRPTLPSIHSLDLPFLAPSCPSPSSFSFSSSSFFSTYRRSSSLVSSEGSEDWETSRSPSPASSLSSFSSFSSTTSVSSRPPSPPSDPSPLEPPTSSFPFSRPSYNEPPSSHTHASSSASLRSTSIPTRTSTTTKLRLAPCALADLDAVILIPSSAPSLSPPSPSPYTPTSCTNGFPGTQGKPLLLTGPAAQAFKHPSALKALGRSARVRVHPYRIVSTDGGGVRRRASVAGFGYRSEYGVGYEGRRSEVGMPALRAALSRI